MKILIFENQFNVVEDAFNLCNELYFESQLIYDVYIKYQDFKDIDKLNNYIAIIIDIELAKNSNLDGFGILEILERRDVDSQKIMIMTGHELLDEELKKRNVNRKYEVITKPIDHRELKGFIEKAIQHQSPLE